MKRILFTLSAFALFAASAALADECAPAKVTNLTFSTGHSTGVLTWTDPGDDCNTGTAASYEIRRSSSAITDTNWQSASVFLTGTPSGGNGTTECRDFSGLTCNTTYYFVIFFFDAAGNRSPISNNPHATTKACNNFIEILCE